MSQDNQRPPVINPAAYYDSWKLRKTVTSLVFANTPVQVVSAEPKRVALYFGLLTTSSFVWGFDENLNEPHGLSVNTPGTIGGIKLDLANDGGFAQQAVWIYNQMGINDVLTVYEMLWVPLGA